MLNAQSPSCSACSEWMHMRVAGDAHTATGAMQIAIVLYAIVEERADSNDVQSWQNGKGTWKLLQGGGRLAKETGHGHACK
eukprot:3176662-Amphidinium_carterae.1